MAGGGLVAGKRMFSREVLCSDAYTDLSFEAQSLYVQLCMDADDWGFVGAPKRLQRSIGTSESAMKELHERGFVRTFESGALVILDWWRNNTITESRRKPTAYPSELSMLTETESGRYEPVDDKAYEQHANAFKEHEVACKVHASKEEVSSVEVSTDKGRKRKRFVKPTREELLDFCRKEGLTCVEREVDRFIDYYESNGWMVGKNHMKDWRATARNWERRKSAERGNRDEGVFDAIGAAIGG